MGIINYAHIYFFVANGVFAFFDSQTFSFLYRVSSRPCVTVNRRHYYSIQGTTHCNYCTAVVFVEGSCACKATREAFPDSDELSRGP